MLELSDIIEAINNQPAPICYQYIYNLLLPTIDNTQECRAVTKLLLEHYLDYTLSKQILNTPLKASKKTIKKLYTALHRLQKKEPIQYVLGFTSFGGYNFKVTPDVLIPRRETEELVDYIIKQKHKPSTSILDLCTGSGCIAICLKKAYKNAIVEALDTDTKALEIASQNAKHLGVQINWYNKNLLYDPLPNKKWELIVSNPPYVPCSEKSNTATSVLDYEPHKAIFVDDNNPLIFYEKIALLSKQHLVTQGHLYVEINETFAKEVSNLFQKAGLKKIQIHQDLQNKDRWIACRR